MKALQVLERYYRKVPFPMTPPMIEAAGYDVGLFLYELIDELNQCEDRDLPQIKKTLVALDKLKKNISGSQQINRLTQARRK